MNFEAFKRQIPWIVNVFLFLSIGYFFSGIFFGLDFTDSFYHLNQALHPADGIYLYPFFLSSLIIKSIVGILGPEIIYLRFINSLLLFFSLLMPFVFVKIEKPRTEVFFYIACILFLFAPFNVNILGYDSLSIFTLSFIFSLSILYLKSSKLYLLLFLSILCSAAVLIRLPNILVIPILFLTIGFNEKIRRGGFSLKAFKLPMIFLFLTLVWVFLGYAMYYLSFEDFIGASANANSHDLKILFYHYFKDGLKLILFVSIILGGYYFFKKLQDFKPKILIYAVLGIVYMLFLTFFVILTKYWQNYSLFLTSLAISIITIQITQNRKDMLSIKHIVLYLYFLFLFINPLGSNTGLLKAVSFFLLLPFVLSINDLKVKQYWLLIFIILLPFSIIEKFYSSYEDKGILSLNRTSELKLLNYINTNEARADFLENINAEVSKLKNDNIHVYFYGDKSHIFHYLYPETNMNINSFFQPVEELMYNSEIKKNISHKNSTAIFIVDSYPSEISTKPTPLENFLLDLGFKKTSAGKIKYYLRVTNK